MQILEERDVELSPSATRGACRKVGSLCTIGFYCREDGKPI